MATVLITLGFVALFFVLMSVRLIFLKNGEFKGTCASQSPFLNQEGVTCSYCGKTVDSSSNCGKPESEVDKVMAKFK
ncbi:hypothetical protein ACFPIK_14355 [Algoriphagus aquatilis]|uniref:Membrane or secreted protein n=1 Tax=Algoriphagus aquatilis TaxID=490186 RepID=A0ABW0BYB9_9BACT|nr:hypothetical protein [Algoriphagus sp.]